MPPILPGMAPPQPLPTDAPQQSHEDAAFVAPELLAPNNTVYVNNINEKVKLPDLKRELTAVFSEHGKVRVLSTMQYAHTHAGYAPGCENRGAVISGTPRTGIYCVQVCRERCEGGRGKAGLPVPRQETGASQSNR